MRSGDPQVTVRGLVGGILYRMKDLIFTFQATDATHTPIWASPTNFLLVFLPISMTFISL